MAANRIQINRERLGISREKLATILEKSYSSIVAYEQGTRDPDSGTWKKLAELFDRSVDELMGLDIKRPISSDLEEDWTEVVQVLRMSGKLATPEERRRIARIIRASLEED